MAVARFTEAWVRGAPEGQYTDGTLPGFMCVVGKTRTTWYAQAKVRGGRQTKVRVGHWPDVPQVEARRMAADALAAMRRGEDPGEAERARRARPASVAGRPLRDPIPLRVTKFIPFDHDPGLQIEEPGAP